MEDNLIRSVRNPRVKQAVRLRDGRHRAKQGRFLIDGPRELLRALEAGMVPEETFVHPASCQNDACREALAKLSDAGAMVTEVSQEVLEKLAYGDRTGGFVSVVATPTVSLADLALPPNALIAVVERVEKPGNVGAVLRSADGAGLAAVIVADGATDLYNPNTIRASLGALFAMPTCTASTPETIAWLKEHGFNIIAAHVDATTPYTQACYDGRAAIVLGSEAVGLSPAWGVGRTVSVCLPMRGTGDSLNVSAAAAVLFYEALRQRDARQM